MCNGSSCCPLHRAGDPLELSITHILAIRTQTNPHLHRTFRNYYSESTISMPADFYRIITYTAILRGRILLEAPQTAQRLTIEDHRHWVNEVMMSELVHLIAADMEWDMDLRAMGIAVAYGAEMWLVEGWMRMVNALIGTWAAEGKGPAVNSTMAKGLKAVGSKDLVNFIPVGHVEFGRLGKRVVAGRVFLRGWQVRYLACTV